MSIFGVRKALAAGVGLPDLSSAPRRYRPALLGAARRVLAVVGQQAKQGRPVEQQPLAERGRTVELFWRFLEAELSDRRLGPMWRIQADPRVGLAAQTAYEWCAQRCGMRPATAICLAWATQLDKDAREAYTRAQPEAPAEEVLHFAGVAEGGAARVPLDGVLQVRRDGLKFIVSGESAGLSFTAQNVTTTEDAEGIRLVVGEPLPYDTILALASMRRGALDAALKRAGVVRD